MRNDEPPPPPKPRLRKTMKHADEPVVRLPTPVALSVQESIDNNPDWSECQHKHITHQESVPMPTPEAVLNKIVTGLGTVANTIGAALKTISDASVGIAKAFRDHLLSETQGVKSASFSTVEVAQTLAICVGSGIVLGSQPVGSMCDVAAISAILMCGYFCIKRRWTPNQQD